ncbi:MAG: endonuclease III [Bacteroidota bacterium]|nr:endonuclease III [Bacteroidota bacterium]
MVSGQKRFQESGARQDKSRRASVIEQCLRRAYPKPAIALHFSTPLQLLVAVILSAQCTDARVNIVTKELFKKYRTANDFANAKLKELEKEIHSTGFYKSKAKNIVACCQVLVEKYGGQVPQTMEELTALAGVGRKTANCLLGGCFNIPSGIVVDTHVKRLANRLGLSKQDDPEKIESDLMELLPQKDWIHFGNALIHHGRKICNARKPLCAECVLNDLCPLAFTIV